MCLLSIHSVDGASPCLKTNRDHLMKERNLDMGELHPSGYPCCDIAQILMNS